MLRELKEREARKTKEDQLRSERKASGREKEL